MSNKTIARTTDTATRYIAVGTHVHDTQGNRTAGIPTPSGAHVAAEWLNGAHASPDDYGWTETARTGFDIHPEIPSPHWADTRYLDDDDREVIDERHTSHGGYDIELSRMHTFTNGGLKRHADNAFVRFDTVWPDGEGIDHESFTVLPKDIPGLISALQHAHDLMNNEPRTLRRNPDATAELAARDA